MNLKCIAGRNRASRKLSPLVLLPKNWQHFYSKQKQVVDDTQISSSPINRQMQLVSDLFEHVQGEKERERATLTE